MSPASVSTRLVIFAATSMRSGRTATKRRSESCSHLRDDVVRSCSRSRDFRRSRCRRRLRPSNWRPDGSRIGAIGLDVDVSRLPYMIIRMAKAKTKKSPRDDLENYIAERTARNRDFPRLMEAAAERKRLLQNLAAARRAARLTQADVAARMRTSVSAVARLERGEMNPTVATLQRFASAVGRRIDWRLVRGA